MVRKRTMLVAALVLVASIGVACGGSNERAGNGGGRAVAISGFLFKPEKLSVRAGTAVTWTNGDDIDHTVTAGTPEASTGAFDSGNTAKGGTFTQTFMEPGTFAYFCKNHNGMRGEVTVT